MGRRVTMRLAPLLLLVASLTAVDYVVPEGLLPNGQPDPRAGMHLQDPPPRKSITDTEVFVFGKSYHTNRSVDWNENNQGAAVGLAYHYDLATDITFVTGGYKDSYGDVAKFSMVGARYILGDRYDWHASVNASIGYFKGSGWNLIGAMPVVSVGYDWFDLCFTGLPPSFNGDHNNSGSRDPRHNHGESTGFIGVFARFRVLTF